MLVFTRNLGLAYSAVVVVCGLLSLSCRARSEVSSRDGVDAQRRARPAVAALGRLEPRGGIVDVGGMAGERLDRVTVAEGDTVTQGQELAYLSSYPLRQSEKELADIQLAEGKIRGEAERAYAEALVAEATAAFDELKLADLDVQALAAKIESLELNLKIANRDHDRLSGAGEAVSPQEQDHQQLVVEQAKAELHSTRAQLAKVEATRAAREREGKAKLQTAQANLARVKSSTQPESLEKAAAAAAQKLELSVVHAPRAGRVLAVVMRAGETVGPRPILRLGDTDQMYATAEIYETDVHLVHAGQQARITSDALSEPLTGTVESVSKTVAKNEVVSLDPTAAADARVVLARIRLDDSREAANLVDLQVDVLIDTEKPAATPAANDRPASQ
jgi:HlyD family secretion protein